MAYKGYNDHDADDTQRDTQRPPKYKGALAVRAKARGMSKRAYAEANMHTNSVVGKMARLAHIADGVHGSGKSTQQQAGDKRSLGQRIYQLG